jgi:hypothetical protein
MGEGDSLSFIAPPPNTFLCKPFYQFTDCLTGQHWARPGNRRGT